MCRPTAAPYLQKLIAQHSTLTALISAVLKRLQGFYRFYRNRPNVIRCCTSTAAALEPPKATHRLAQTPPHPAFVRQTSRIAT
ncbi:hypothetical protein HK15_05240 [Acetobacter orientalis]|uniref:Uncharacterized protein n=1 Tax=Acetobacter orientalis TaxID=146474 RepID=A0A252BDP8_9PROT|nr:hypothetical protein HK15_05240 [Acetobacter orientalis]